MLTLCYRCLEIMPGKVWAPHESRHVAPKRAFSYCFNLQEIFKNKD